MTELFPTIQSWTESEKSFAIATVIKTWGSSPRPVGSAMIISEEMEMAGSVSGGCVEGAVIKASLPVIESGKAAKLAFGVTDEEAWEVGLSCGGSIQVFSERFLAFDPRPEEQEAWKSLLACIKENKPCVLLTHLDEENPHHVLVFPDGSFKGHQVDPDIIREAVRAYRERKNQTIEHGETAYFAQLYPRKSQMLIIGAAHITVDLVQMANLFGFETIVIDPRGAFTHKTQFSSPPDQLFEKYPEEVLPDYTLDAFTYAVVLSHDPKIDDNALHFLLKSNVAYIGALGSKRTHAKRIKRLTEAGFSEEEIARIKAPIGLDIRARFPREIALSIMGEIIQEQNKFF